VNLSFTKILLVEDSESDADLLQEKLHAVGVGVFEITVAPRLEQAIALLRQTTFDAILTDMNLPDSAGKETFLRLRAAAPGLPIVVLTGTEDEQLGLEAVRLGIQDYLAKSSADGPQIARAIRYAVERARTREALRESEARYRTLFESMTEGFVQYEIVFDERQQPGDFRFVAINPAVERLTGLKPADVIGRGCGEVAVASCFYSADVYRRVATTGDPVRFETFVPALNKYFAASAYRPAPNQLSVIFRDITERKVHEAELQKLNRTLRALSGSNQAMMRATDEVAYLQDVCRVLAEDCGHVMVWIGFAEEDAGRTVRPVAHAGFDEGYLEALGVTWSDIERGRGPTGTAIRTGKVVRCDDMLTNRAFAPWQAEALKRGFASSLAIPLIADDRTLGAITIYSRQTAPFTTEEVKLLTELAGDVSYGLTVLRMRAAHARAEQATREQEQELTAIYENAPLVMMLVDDGYCIRKANKPAELLARATELAGRNAAEALGCVYAAAEGWHCGLALACRHCALRRCIDQTIQTGSGPQQLEFTVPLVAGDPRQGITFLVSAMRIMVRGRPLALVTMQDITRRKQAEEVVERARAELEVRVTERTAQLRALTAELIQSEERERRRIARLLHDDLQQLLMAAKLHVEIARGRPEGKPLAGELRQIEEMIAESGAAARELSHELSPSILHEYGLVAGLRWLGRWMHEKHGLTVRVVGTTAPDAVEPEVAVLLFQSVRELLFNVVKHAGVKRASVRIGSTPDGGIEIRVSDKGRGVKTPPTRVGRPARTGFGLFSVRERIEFLGGRMEIESTPGRGCCFRLSAPLRKAPEPLPSARAKDLSSRRQPEHPTPEPTAGSRAAKRPATAPPAKIRVLLVDDHQVVREGLTTLLAQCPDLAVVGQAADGHAAIELAATLQPQVVLMDVNMPRLNGIEATRQIAAAWPRIKVIGLTMHTDESCYNAMRAAGAMDCLAKNGPTETLLHAIRAAGSTPVRGG
jgi:PAS domain S-box-containing protein